MAKLWSAFISIAFIFHFFEIVSSNDILSLKKDLIEEAKIGKLIYDFEYLFLKLDTYIRNQYGSYLTKFTRSLKNVISLFFIFRLFTDLIMFILFR